MMVYKLRTTILDKEVEIGEILMFPGAEKREGDLVVDLQLNFAEDFLSLIEEIIWTSVEDIPDFLHTPPNV